MYVDFVLNGTPHGAVAQRLENAHFDAGLLRPYFDERGVRCVTMNSGKKVYDNAKGVYRPLFKKVPIADLMRNGIHDPVHNATTLSKLQWEELDRAILKAARYRLRAWTDLASRNSHSVPGMSKMILEHETMSDPGEAQVSMEGLEAARTDTPLMQLQGLPLPITHSDFWFSKRRLEVSRTDGRTGLDMTMVEAAGRRVAESIEKTLIGTVTGVTYGGGSNSPSYGTANSRASKVYGYTNFPGRLTKTNLTTPTGSNAASTLADVLAMRDQLTANKFYGPFMLYTSANWDQYLDNDYILSGGNVATQTLRERLKAIDGIEDVRRLDFLTSGYQFIMVQMTSDVCRAINGMDITTIQWEAMGGWKLNFRVMAIQVPDLRCDYNGNCGILHATTS